MTYLFIAVAAITGLIIGSLITAYVLESVFKTAQIRAAQAHQTKILRAILTQLQSGQKNT